MEQKIRRLIVEAIRNTDFKKKVEGWVEDTIDNIDIGSLVEEKVEDVVDDSETLDLIEDLVIDYVKEQIDTFDFEMEIEDAGLMAITCYWKDVVGTVKHQDRLLTIYGGGNVCACFCLDEKTDTGETIHHLQDFFVDKDHLKRILADVNHYSEYSDWWLNANYNEVWQIAKILVKNGHEVTISTLP